MQNLNLVPMNGLRAVEAVGRLGSLQAAALEFGVSIGAISQQIHKTEAQLGHALFERTGRGMKATAFGRPVLIRLSEAFLLMSEAVALAARQDNSILTISVAPVFASRWLVARLEGFTELNPEIGLRIDASTRLVDPASTDVDICIRVGNGSWRDARVEKILDQQVFPVCAPALAARLGKPEDLANFPVIIDSHAMFGWDVWLETAGLGGLELSTRHSFSEASLCLDATIGGQGVMLAWQTLACDAIADGRLVLPFSSRAKTGFGHYFITPRQGKEPAKVRAFKTWIRAEVAASMKKLDALFPVG